MAGKKKQALDDLFDSDDEVLAERTIIPTGIALVDPALGGGIPAGVLGEVFGPSGSGKTSLMYCHIAQQQKRGNVSILVDAEGSWNPLMGERYGIDPMHVNDEGQKTFRKMSDSGALVIEPLFSRLKTILHEMPEVKFILVDSLAALATSKSSERKDDGQTQTDAMQKANVLSVMFRDLRRWIEETGSKCSVVFINHEKEVIEMGGIPKPGPKLTNTPGGRAPKFYSTFRLRFEELTKKDKIKVHDPVTGYDVSKVDKVYIRVTAVKNRVSVPFVPATFIFDLGGGTGIDTVSTAFAHALAQKIIKKGGGGIYTVPAEWTVDGEELTLKGKEAVKQYYTDNRETFERLEQYLAENLSNSREVFVAEEDDEDEITLDAIRVS